MPHAHSACNDCTAHLQQRSSSQFPSRTSLNSPSVSLSLALYLSCWRGARGTGDWRLALRIKLLTHNIMSHLSAGTNLTSWVKRAHNMSRSRSRCRSRSRSWSWSWSRPKTRVESQLKSRAEPWAECGTMLSWVYTVRPTTGTGTTTTTTSIAVTSERGTTSRGSPA